MGCRGLCCLPVDGKHGKDRRAVDAGSDAERVSRIPVDGGGVSSYIRIVRMSNFRLIDRDTGILMPPSVDDWLPDRHLARFVVEVIATLDLRSMIGRYRGSGEASYHPQLLLGIIVYGYATGVSSSRKLEWAIYDSVTMRFLASNEHPDHDTIATLRRHFLPQIEALFVQILGLEREIGLLKLGTVALDGTNTLLTNDMQRSAVEIAHLYRGRWQIELLFRRITQHLKIRKLLVNNDNAIRLQRYAAMIAHVLLRIAARAHSIKLPILRLTDLVTRCLLERRNLTTIEKPSPVHPSPNQHATPHGQSVFQYA